MASVPGESSTPIGPTAETYHHPLYAKLGGDIVDLSGHLEAGVTSVLTARAQEVGFDLSKVTLVRLANSPQELEEGNN